VPSSSRATTARRAQLSGMAQHSDCRGPTPGTCPMPIGVRLRTGRTDQCCWLSNKAMPSHPLSRAAGRSAGSTTVKTSTTRNKAPGSCSAIATPGGPSSGPRCGASTDADVPRRRGAAIATLRTVRARTAARPLTVDTGSLSARTLLLSRILSPDGDHHQPAPWLVKLVHQEQSSPGSWDEAHPCPSPCQLRLERGSLRSRRHLSQLSASSWCTLASYTSSAAKLRRRSAMSCLSHTRRSASAGVSAPWRAS
jgi:hypothetical protein